MGHPQLLGGIRLIRPGGRPAGTTLPVSPANADRVEIAEADRVVTITTDDSCLDDEAPDGREITEVE